MSKVEDSVAALESRDWASAEVVESPRTPTVVQSVRMSRDLTERVYAEAQRRGVTPSDVIRDLVEAGLSQVDESATVRLADVRRVIESLARLLRSGAYRSRVREDALADVGSSHRAGLPPTGPLLPGQDGAPHGRISMSCQATRRGLCCGPSSGGRDLD